MVPGRGGGQQASALSSVIPQHPSELGSHVRWRRWRSKGYFHKVSHIKLIRNTFTKKLADRLHRHPSLAVPWCANPI
jgi:hypothetical protein